VIVQKNKKRKKENHQKQIALKAKPFQPETNTETKNKIQKIIHSILK
jgi:hypothetical protein